MNLASRLFGDTQERAGLVELFPTWANQTSESAPSGFDQFANRLYLANPVIFRAVAARMMLYSEIRFAYRRLSDKTLFRTPSLRILEQPWPNGTTGELLKRMEQDASLAGNAFIYKASPTQLQRLRPDRVEILSNGRDVIGYAYYPNGMGQGSGQIIFVEDMAHYAPIPHPTKNWLGVSWIQSVLAEAQADQRMTAHQNAFYKNAATPNLFVKIEGSLTDESRTRLRQELDRRYGGWQNAYKTIVLDGGADLKAVGADFQQADFVATKEANENRIALASSVPPIILGISRGLESGTYSNYEQQLKQFAITLRDLWRSSADALASIVTIPRGAELWWDETEVTALQDNAKNRAEIRQIAAATINTLITAGYEPASVIEAVETGDFSSLEHTGLFSVQLQPAGANQSAGGNQQEPPPDAVVNTE